MDIQSKSLKTKIAWARNAIGTPETAREAMDCMDATSLSGAEHKSDIQKLTSNAMCNNLASVCIYPEHVATANAVKTAKKNNSLRVATVIDFPHGNKQTGSENEATTETVAQDVTKAIASGATQIDIVFPYEEFLSQSKGEGMAQELLSTCREACGDDATMKVILETAAFNTESKLREACKISIAAGADCLKTSTGKHPNGGATLETAAILMDEAHKSKRDIGVKISGGVQNNNDCAQYIALARSVFGWDSIRPEKFRIGASANKLLPDLLSSLDPNYDAPNNGHSNDPEY